MTRPLPLLLLAVACTPDPTDTGRTLVDPPWPFTVVDTDQTRCYDTTGEIACPAEGADLHGQDAQYLRFPPAYADEGDGTVTDLQTGLTWQQGFQEDVAWADAEGSCAALDQGGLAWRVPTIKELYSLMQFDGSTGTNTDPEMGAIPDDAVPYLDTGVFDFAYGDVDGGRRFIDAQYISSDRYASRVFADDDGLEPGEECFFGVNFADGRIKCYPTGSGGGMMAGWMLRCVSGGGDYGVNDLEDGGDGTVRDHATGLAWMQEDSGHHGAGDQGDGTMDWPAALAFCEDLALAGHEDWRLPDAKELHSIVDTTRSPDTTGSAALDPLFLATSIVSEDGHDDFGWYWTGTTHLDGLVQGADAAYVAFGEALGHFAGMDGGEPMFMDVHGAGAQRGDPKTGSRDEYPTWGDGPQGDVRRVFNLVRCVRDDG